MDIPFRPEILGGSYPIPVIRSHLESQVPLTVITYLCAQSMICSIGRIHNGHQVVFCFMYATTSHYCYYYSNWAHAVKGREAWINSCQVYNVESVSNRRLVLLVTFLYLQKLWRYICSTPPFEVRWSRAQRYQVCTILLEIVPPFS